MDKLKEYKAKRNFSVTTEPEAGPWEPEQPLPEADGRYVVQEHHARRLHWDFRLEMDGVLKSWAVPKGPPQEKGQRRLAIEVEDHPLEYGKFEGTIPEGNYGAGKVMIWDKGYYTLLKKEADKVKFVLSGDRLQGAYILIKRGQKENHWLFIKYR